MQREGLIALSIVLTLSVLAGQQPTAERQDADVVTIEQALSEPAPVSQRVAPDAPKEQQECRTPSEGSLHNVSGANPWPKQISVSI